MKDLPILFSGPMVRAILSGAKTETRRILKETVPPPPAMDAINPRNIAKHPAPYLDSYCGDRKTEANPRGMSRRWCWWTRDDRQWLPTFAVKYVPGDRFWVREQFSGNYNYDKCSAPPRTWDIEGPIWYWADGNPEDGDWTKPKPSIHMPRWASRITLEVTGVRIERLHEITEDGARAEGVTMTGKVPREECEPFGGPFRCLFANLWNSLHGKDAWSANPWVTVTQFRRIKQPTGDDT